MGAEAAAVRVLVVDDSPVDRRVVELLLRAHCGGGGGEAAPFHVTAVDSGKKAMELLGRRRERDHLIPSSPAAAANEQAIDIVLTDYCMPEMTGYDLLKAIKALGSPNPIPVVVMSSENEPQRISRCLTAGAEDFILKPLKINDVQRLRKCSGASKPKAAAAVAGDDDRCCNTLSSSSMKKVMNASSFEVSHYFQLIFKFILLAYAVLCLSQLLHRWSNGSSLLSLWCA
uniref:Response regulatory domain-containing protein n=1 Tax=Oryza punctata TaxID=4537 RepID=A0A0E0K160_ORYPU